MTLVDDILNQARAWSLVEIVAVAAAVLYLLLAIRQNIWCWLFAAISTAIYVWVFAGAKLYMESGLNVFYFAMAVYGWMVWRSGTSGRETRPIVVWSFGWHAGAILVISAVSLLSGWLLSKTDAAFPYVDSATTWFAIWATFLVARKVLQNWWYWLVIDAVSVAIYWARDLQLTSLLFVLYLAMIPFGLMAWSRSYRNQPS